MEEDDTAVVSDRIYPCFLLQAVAASITAMSVTANTPISSVQVTLRGKKYDIEDVTTVSELQERLAEASGVSPTQQGRVLFNGKRLDGSEALSIAGVGKGDQLNVVPGKPKSKSKASSAGASAASAAAPSTSSNAMKDMLEGSGLDTSNLDEMMKNMGVGKDGEAPNLSESMEMMSNMMKSPIFTEYMNDPEKLEQSRQMILQNPMLKSMMGNMPGMEDILNSPEAWREAMQAAASMYQNMDQNDLMQAMMGMGGAAGGGGGMEMPPGLFDGTSPAEGTSALDELSEED